MAEFIAYAPYGNTVCPGYFNTEPNATPRFALTAGDAGLAVEIGQYGGNVNVDTFGGVNMLASSGAFMGIDSFANISLNTSNTDTAQITLTSQSTISMTTTTGSIYLGAGGGAPGANVDIFNAGTIQFDPLGFGAITGVQTINGAVYPPPGGGGGTSITQAGALVACLGSGGVAISSIGLGADVEIYNAGTLRFDTMGQQAIEGLSTINGSAYPPAPYELPADITVSTLTAGSYVSALSFTDVSSITNSADIDIFSSNASVNIYADGGKLKLINGTGLESSASIVPSIDGNADIGIAGQAWSGVFANTGYFSTLQNISSINSGSGDLHIAGNNNLDLVAINLSVLDPGGAGLQVVSGATKISGVNGLQIDANLSVSTITDVSTINGSAYPPAPYELPADITVSTLTAASYVSTLGLEGISSINGEAYPPPPPVFPENPSFVSVTASSYISTLALEGVSSINGNAFPGAVSWTSTLGSGGFTSTINGANITSPSVVFTPITFPQVGDYTIYQKVSMIKTAGGAGQDLHINVLYDDGSAPDVNNIYQGIGVLPYVNDNVSTFTTVVANARVSTIGDTKSIALLDQSGHSYTVNIIAANPIIQFNAPLA